MIDLGLVSGRAASAMRKIQQDVPLDEIDAESLTKIRDLVRASADSVQFFDSGGKAGRLPADSLAPQIETAIEVALREPSLEDADRLAETLRQLADSIETVIKTSHADVAGMLSDYLQHLSTSVLRETASVGETTGRL